MNLSAVEELPFQTVYTALWKKPLYSVFHDVPADSNGTVLKYIPSSVIAKLRLAYMGYHEDVLLVREEYDTAFDTFQDWNLGGAVVTGQPDNGAC